MTSTTGQGDGNEIKIVNNNTLRFFTNVFIQTTYANGTVPFSFPLFKISLDTFVLESWQTNSVVCQLCRTRLQRNKVLRLSLELQFSVLSTSI